MPLLERSHHRRPVVRRSTPGGTIRRGEKEEERRTSLAARTSGVFWFPHRRPLPRGRETIGRTLQGMRTRRLTQRRGEEESMEEEEH
jgi:hypothetical protein